MAQENNTAREQTALEKLSQDALNQARRERKMIQDTCIAELAQCDTEIPETLEKQVQAEIASLQQAKENLSSAHKIASSTVDELSARAADVAKSLNRKWYRINPPSNTAIDVQEEEKSFFARGMNGYKIALIVFIGSFAGVLGARLGVPILDPIASIVICLFIFKVAYGIFHESIDRLVDRACDPDTVAAMRETMQRTPGVVRVDDIKTRLFGSRTYVDAEIAVDGALPLRDAHVIAEVVHHELERDYPDVKHCTVHVNPA